MRRAIERETTRRAVLRAGAVAGTTAALGAAVVLQAGTASATSAVGIVSAAASRRSQPPCPPDVTDTSHCTPRAAEIFRGFYTARSEHNAAKLMSYFSKANAYYIDASAGMTWPNWGALSSFFSAFFASNPPLDAISYPLRIVGDERSALVEFEDVPQLFGKELRILGSVTFDRNQKIIRWIDYWDGRSALIQNTIGAAYPTDFRDTEQNAAPEVIAVARALQAAFAAGAPPQPSR
jgi:hypothetical protein